MTDTEKLSQLLTDLKSPDSDLRRAAAQLLGDWGERAIYPLIKVLSDENPAIAESAAISLLKIGGEVTAYMLQPLLRKEAVLRNSAVTIMIELGSLSVPFVYDLLKDKDCDIRKFALDILGDIKDGVDGKRIVKLLYDPNPNVRVAATSVLGRIKDPLTINHLIKALDDNEDWVIFGALLALTEFNDESIVEVITNQLKSESELVRFAALEALGNIPSKKAKDALIKYYLSVSDLTQDMALKSLIKHGLNHEIPDVSDRLMTLLYSSVWDDVFLAIKGIVDINETKALPKIIDIAGGLDPFVPEEDEKIFVLKMAAESIADCNTLIDMLKIDGLKYRAVSMIISLIGTKKCTRAFDRLVALIDAPERKIRRTVFETLSLLSDKLSETQKQELCQLFINSLYDTDGHVIREVAKGLGRLKCKNAFDKLVKRLGTVTFPDVQQEIVNVLSELDHERFIQNIDDFIG